MLANSIDCFPMEGDVIRIVARRCDTGEVFTVIGREAWALHALIKAGECCTSITQAAPRWPLYVAPAAMGRLPCGDGHRNAWRPLQRHALALSPAHADDDYRRRARREGVIVQHDPPKTPHGVDTASPAATEQPKATSGHRDPGTLREATAQDLAMVRFYADSAIGHADAGDDTGLAYAMAMMVNHAKSAGRHHRVLRERKI